MWQRMVIVAIPGILALAAVLVLGDPSTGSGQATARAAQSTIAPAPPPPLGATSTPTASASPIGATSTPTPSASPIGATSTPTPSASPIGATSTPTPSATSTCCQAMFFSHGGVPSCQGSTYRYWIEMTNYCPSTQTVPLSITFQVATDTGPWTTYAVDNETFSVPPGGTTVLDGEFPMASIPPQYTQFQILAHAQALDDCWTWDATLGEGPICRPDTPTPSATTTRVPPATPTPSPPPSPHPPTPSPTAACPPGWAIVPAPNVGFEANSLARVAVISPADAWAVGTYANHGSTFRPQTLTEHWDGHAWTYVPSPSVGTGMNDLKDVAAVAAADVWTVGSADTSTSTVSLAEHWDGRAWAVVPSANFGPPTYFYGVAARAANDVWAVGEADGNPPAALIAHWDGTRWTRVPSPGSDWSVLQSVTALAADNAWAAGYIWHNNGWHTLIEHWDGSAWSIVPSPDAGPHNNYLYRITASGPSDLWAVGYTDTNFNSPYATLILHWNGNAWAIVPSPDPGQQLNWLMDVAAQSADDIWAVGTYDAYYETDAALALHWDGTAWTAQFPPSPGFPFTGLGGVAADKQGGFWAVGGYQNQTGEPLLVERYGPLCPTPTPCPIEYSDVPANSPFYPYIRGLACRGILNGYSTAPPCAVVPCFLPGASITRGQVSKLVANAAGFAEPVPSTQQTFTDVPYGSPFWFYVERLAGHYVINGYNGSPPCPPGQTPCFLPAANLTRGELAKIAAGAVPLVWPAPAPGQQTYADVPPDHPFWEYIEAAAGVGVISGYAGDGHTVNPCTGQIEAAGQRYFRPCANVTRGQTAKIVANAFFFTTETRRHGVR